VLAAWLLIWQAAYLIIGQDLLLASPLQVLLRLAGLLRQGAFWHTALMSLLRIQTGFLIGLVLGTLLAVGTVRLIWLDRFLAPAIGAIRSTPVASFIILALVWMSSGRVVVFIVVLMVLPIVWGNVTEGIRKTDPHFLEMAHVFRLKPAVVLRVIFLPSVMPFFVSAAITSLGLGWKAGIAAEVLSRPPLSLGGRLYDARIYLDTVDLLAFTGVVIGLSLLLEQLLLYILRLAGQYFRRHGRMGNTARPAGKGADA
jgi:NitT/TauT family transport system permease protein